MERMTRNFPQLKLIPLVVVCPKAVGTGVGMRYHREREMNDRDPEKGFVKLTWRDHKRFSDSYLISYLCRLSFPIFVKAASADHPRIRTGAEGCK